MAISIIKKTRLKRTIPNLFNSNYTTYIHELSLEDGTIGDFFSEDNPLKFTVGDEIEYTYKQNENTNYRGRISLVKVVNNKQSFGFPKKNQSSENARVALIAAKDMYANGEKNKDVLVLANEYFDWLQGKTNM